MINRLKDPFFLGCLVLFALHQITQKGLELRLPLADNYLDNLLCLPVFLGFWLAERGLLWKQRRLSAFETAAAWIILSFIFEVIFPRLSDGFTPDWMDVLLYGLGALLFYYFINPPVSPKSPSIPPHI